MGVAQPAAASLAMPPKRPPDSLGRPLNPGSDKVEVETGCGAAWLARLSGGQEVPGSNPGTPTGEEAGIPCDSCCHSSEPPPLSWAVFGPLGWCGARKAGKRQTVRGSALERSRAELSPKQNGQLRCLRFARRSGPCSFPVYVLALDDVVDLQNLGLTWLDADVLQHRHETLTERVELLLRVPDLADSQLAVRLEGDVVLESFRQPVA